MSRQLLLALLLLPAGLAQEILLYPEFQRPDIHGDILKPDQGGRRREILSPAVARNGYASFFVVVKLREPGPYRLDIAMNPERPIQPDLYRVWFHKLESDGGYYPDALIPVKNTFFGSLPDPDNGIAGQTAAAFWLDLYIPKDAPAQRVRVEAQLQAGGRLDIYPMEVRILPITIPDEDAIVAGHSTYSAKGLADVYPKLAREQGANFLRSERFFDLIHAYHRIFYEHRGIAPEFAGALEGPGRGKRIVSWESYDRHYGPLFDGSAFRSTRRGPRPIPYVYLPIDPESPANFQNVVSEIEKHFREKGWTKTRVEMFFNHKGRCKGFTRDHEYFRRYHALLRKAVAPDSPVKFIFRADSNSTMEQQFQDLKGVINLWVLGGGILNSHPEAPDMLHRRGDTVWFYSSAVDVRRPAYATVHNPLRAWMWGVDGFALCLVTDSGPDPWFRFNGGRETMVYPAEKFGIEEPIPSLRLKIQRNALQDLALLKALEPRVGRDRLRQEIAHLTNGPKPDDWLEIRRFIYRTTLE